jgi:hypothetical protein
VLVSDTRIPAEATDEGEWEFAAPDFGAAPASVRVRLLYRRTFRSWGRLHRSSPGELELANEVVRVDGVRLAERNTR